MAIRGSRDHPHTVEQAQQSTQTSTATITAWTKKDSSMDFVKHAEFYVRGQVHTNGIENFWSLLKRGIKGTYVSVEPFHTFRYLDEQVFRFNERGGMTSDRFETVMKQITIKRLTFSELTGKAQEGQTDSI
jgi:hypothetical protein